MNHLPMLLSTGQIDPAWLAEISENNPVKRISSANGKRGASSLARVLRGLLEKCTRFSKNVCSWFEASFLSFFSLFFVSFSFLFPSARMRRKENLQRESLWQRRPLPRARHATDRMIRDD